MVLDSIFLAGCIGAIAPEIIRLWEIRNDGNVSFSVFYYIISILYILLGGYIASIFPGITQPFWAACIGAGLVLVVNKMVYIGGMLVDTLIPSGGGGEPVTRGLEAERADRERGSFIEYSRKL